MWTIVFVSNPISCQVEEVELYDEQGYMKGFNQVCMVNSADYRRDEMKMPKEYAQEFFNTFVYFAMKGIKNLK